jgi:hypothetical protein
VFTYLLASLPTLSLDEAPKVSRDDFLVLCERFVSAEEQADLEAVFTPDDPDKAPPNTPVAATWQAWETQWRNAIARQRAARRRLEASPYVRSHPGYRVDIPLAVAEAYTKETPLSRELALDELRWRLLDDLALQDPWGFAALYAYAVKLQLAWRWAGFSDDAGWVALEAALKQLEVSHD